MLRGDWLPGIAVVLILLFAAWISFSLGQNDLEMRGRRPSGDPASCAEGDYANCDTSPMVFDVMLGENVPADPNEKSNRDEYRLERDIRAQRAMAFWAAAMFFATVAGVVLIYRTLRVSEVTETLARKALWQATLTNINTSELMQAQTRAYVGVREAKPNGPNFIDVSIENTGQSPAFNVKISAVFIKTGVHLTNEALDHHSKSVDHSKPRVLLPKQDWTHTVTHSVCPVFEGTYYFPNDFWGYFVGRISYRDIFRRRQVTFFKYMVDQVRPGAHECVLCDDGNYATYDEFTSEGTIAYTAKKMLSEFS